MFSLFSSQNAPIEPNNSPQLFFLAYYILGIVLMISYIWGIVTLQKTYPSPGKVDPIGQYGAQYLWGRIWDDKPLLHVYYGGFVIATTGYLINLPYVTFVMKCMKRVDERLYKGLTYSLSAFMLTELLWMPLCVLYIGNPTTWLFYLIRFQLLCSGISGLSWAYFNWQIPAPTKSLSDALLDIDDEESDDNIKQKSSYPNIWHHRLAQLGATGFAMHCACLDCLVWPGYFENVDGRFPPP